jgi:hypothetical protein
MKRLSTRTTLAEASGSDKIHNQKETERSEVSGNSSKQEPSQKNGTSEMYVLERQFEEIIIKHETQNNEPECQEKKKTPDWNDMYMYSDLDQTLLNPEQLEKMQQNFGRNNLIEIISILDENERKVFEDYASIFKDYVKKYDENQVKCPHCNDTVEQVVKLYLNRTASPTY